MIIASFRKLHKSIRGEGIIETIIKTSRFLINSSLPLIRDFSSYGICKLLGTRLAYSFLLSVFKFRCKHNLFLGKDRSLWLGKSLSDEILETIYISPAEINYVIKDGVVPYIQSGDWDLKKKKFESNTTIKELFIDNVTVKKTTQYKEMLKKIRSKGKAYWCKSEADVERYFKILLKTCDDIRNNRYLSQKELQGFVEQEWKGRYPNEILVSIDRDGNYLHEKGGSHRLSMAKIYSIEKIPVVIIRKHYNYIKSHEKRLKLL